MAIGTGLALLGSAALGAAGSYLGGKSQSKAATQAANISATDNAQNRAFLTDIYNRNSGNLSPFMQPGITSGNAIMELLGFGPQQQMGASAFPGYAPQGYGGGSAFPGYQSGQAMSPYPENWGPNLDGMAQPYSVPSGGVMTTLPSARSAFDTYRGSTGYDFRVNEGNRALQSAFSRNLDSGAASKAAIRFGQGIASDEFGRYIDLLRGQQQLGFGAASALAGVGQQFGNTVTAGNTNAANAQANARLYAGNVAANNWANLGSSFGSVLGFLGK
jgi:hypothetical protein